MLSDDACKYENNELFIGKVRNLTQDFKTGQVKIEKKGKILANFDGKR